MADPNRHSKFLSLVLRHRPGLIGITLDEHGWTDVGELLDALARDGRTISRDELLALIEEDAKGRYALSEDGGRIRAVQGHSVAVDLGYASATPPDLLYHGTVERALASIRDSGLAPRGRQHVHLSPDRDTAMTVGARRGATIVLIIDAKGMHGAEHVFHRADNGVWLTALVPAGYITFPTG